MARILGLLPSALVAARGGMSANAYYNELRSLGIAARRSEVLQLHKIAKSIVVKSPDEPFQNIEQVPAGPGLPPWPTRKGVGIAQTVTLTYRDRTTGQIKQTWWRTVTPNGITREQALATAIDAYSEHAESYDQDIIDAVHTSSYRLVPMGELGWTGKHTGYGPITRRGCRLAWWHSIQKVSRIMMMRLRFRNGASVVLFAGGRTYVRGTTRKRGYSMIQRNSGAGFQSIRVTVHVPWFGHTTLGMTSGFLGCSKYYQNSAFVLNGVIWIETYRPRHGVQITGQSLWLTHGHGYRYPSQRSHHR